MTRNIKNSYMCDTCGGYIVSIDREEGVTPFMISCLATENCDGVMRSSFYSCDQNLIPQWEWYKPASLKGFNDWTKEHIQKGGLVIQRIPPNDHGINDPVLRSVVEYITTLRSVSIANLQRKFRITYMTAARIMDELVTRRYVEHQKDKKGQRVVIDRNRVVPDFIETNEEKNT